MVSMKLNILGISGSVRTRSVNLAILKHIKDIYSNKLDLEIYNEIERLPHFNPDIENDKLPQEVKLLRDKIDSADAIIFCSPEYVFSIPGALKNAIEWHVSTTIFSKKPVGIIIAAASGEKALESLTLIMKTLEAQTSDKIRLLIKGAKGKIGLNDEIKDCDTRNDINMFIEALIPFINNKIV
jgi:chromate reductase, NAD(P)H dehydrogenase (quinone)